ncbi:MAG TPA: LysR family transcriptional regulator [Salinarimonas sp.]|jgi:LysR family transcriptional activator of nhaA|nr:LysR family transcriptional regulator [Salinarimonas sp.]
MAFLNYHHLRYFWAVATEGSLTRAARRLNVSPSALSVQIKALEEGLGHPLFERTGRGLQLTEAGRIALGHAESMFRSGEELVSTLKGLGKPSRQVLRIGAVATLSRNFQLGLLRPLVSRPDIELVVRSGAFDDLLAQLEAHALDLVLANQPATVDRNAEWQNTLVADQPVSLVGRPDDGTGPLAFPDDLARVPVVLPGRGSTIRTAFDALLDEAGIRPAVLAEVDDMAMLRLIARESHAVTLVPPVVVIEELTRGLLVERCSLPRIREAFYAITRRRRFPNPLLRELAMGAG